MSAATTQPGAATTRRDPWDTLFFVVIALGLVVGATLGVREMLDTPPVRLGDERVSIDGGTAVVQVLATNHSTRHAYCVEIRVAALDTDGLDLADVAAASTSGSNQLGPRDTANFVAQIEGLSDQDLDERLDEFSAYVAERRRC